jgi:hypothetical protein
MKFHIAVCGMGLLFAALISGCGKDVASPVGTQLYQRSNPGSEMCVVLAATFEDTSYQTPVSCGTGQYLFAGGDKGIESKILMVFDSTNFSGSLIRAALSFSTSPFVASNSGTVTLSVYKAGIEWTEGRLSWSDVDPQKLEGPIASAEVSVSDTTSVSVEIPNEIAKTLLQSDSSGTKTGLCITVSAGCILRTWSREYSTTSFVVPNVTVYTETDTVSSWPARDGFVATMDRSPDANRLYIQNGVSWRSLLFFDFPEIPSEATINRALLVLHSDPEEAIPAQDSTFNYIIYPLADGLLVDPSNIAADSTIYATAVFQGDSSAVVTTSIIQKLVANKRRKCGLILSGLLETMDLSGRAVFSSSAGSSLTPRLEIFYSLPPSEPY